LVIDHLSDECPVAHHETRLWNLIIKKIARPLVNYVGIKLGILLHGLRHQIAQRTLPAFATDPSNLFIDLPRRFNNSDRISIGDDVSLGPGTFLTATTRYPTNRMRLGSDERPPQTFEPLIRIGHRVSATANLQLAAVKAIIIEDDVMFASNVHINDSSHGYETADQPYKYQPLTRIAPIRIKHGCWIGQNVVISAGVTIGELTIIGANAVVTHDIPAKCIATGTPAKVIKQWNDEEQRWDPVPAAEASVGKGT
jgi:acetyltransferase-like isoleucine patch superfamily enzyme